MFLFKSIGINTFPLYSLERLLVQWESNLTQPASDAKKLKSIRFIIHISRVKLLAWTPVSLKVNHQKHGWRDAIWPIPKLRLNRAGQRLVLRRPAQFLASLMDSPSIREFFCGLKPYLDVATLASEYKRVNDPYTSSSFHFLLFFYIFCSCVTQLGGWACCVWGSQLQGHP